MSGRANASERPDEAAPPDEAGREGEAGREAGAGRADEGGRAREAEPPDEAGRLELFRTGRIDALDAEGLGRLLTRELAGSDDLAGRVTALLAEVRAQGDPALLAMAERFDGVRLDALEVPDAQRRSALDRLPAPTRSALERAAANIRAFHVAQIPSDVAVEVEPGVRLTHVSVPLARAGVYAPGGRAAYPSSVLMGTVPARAAGVREVVVCSPPGPSGLPPDEVLAASVLGGADRLFAVGGAGAIAAMAYGTASIPRVDAVVGPGNRWVTEAKRQVAGYVVIDAPAGPSEVLVLADAGADPELLAAELLAQAEHDPDAACVLVTTSERIATESEAALARQLARTPRREVAARALATAGAVLVAASLDEAVAFAVRYAPEHLSLMTTDAAALARRVPTAGTTFVGPWASVAFGDYMTGGNHVLPTAGRARSFSGLSTAHFLRTLTIQEIDEGGAAAMASDVARLADAEGLPAHAAAARLRAGGPPPPEEATRGATTTHRQDPDA